MNSTYLSGSGTGESESYNSYSSGFQNNGGYSVSFYSNLIDRSGFDEYWFDAYGSVSSTPAGLNDVGFVTAQTFMSEVEAHSTTWTISEGGYFAPNYDLNHRIGYDYAGFATLVSTTTPLPAALSMFATGLGALGLLGWRRRRKNTAAAIGT